MSEPKSMFDHAALADAWVCHQCEMVGSEVEARAHNIVQGHDIERLSDAVARGEVEIVEQS